MHIIDPTARRVLLVAGCLCGLTSSAWAHEAVSPAADPPRASGVVAELSGGPAELLSGESSRLLKVGDVVTAGETIHTPRGTAIAVLWDHRAVFTLHEDSRMQIEEPHRGQLDLRLYRGTLRSVLSYNAGRVTDRLRLETNLARIVIRGGILEAIIEDRASGSLLARLLTLSPAERLRIVEGQAQVDLLTGEGKSVALKTGFEVSLSAGKAASVRAREPDVRSGISQAPTEHRRGVPETLTRHIVTTQIAIALETEEELQRARRAAMDKETGRDTVLGTILPTTTGLPVSAVAQVSGTPGPAGSPIPPASSFFVSTPSVATPLPGAGSLGPAQSGGRNTTELLQQLVKEAAKGPKDKGKK